VGSPADAGVAATVHKNTDALRMKLRGHNGQHYAGKKTDFHYVEAWAKGLESPPARGR
jgi:hypothetical protein